MVTSMESIKENNQKLLNILLKILIIFCISLVVLFVISLLAIIFLQPKNPEIKTSLTTIIHTLLML